MKRTQKSWFLTIALVLATSLGTGAQDIAPVDTVSGARKAQPPKPPTVQIQVTKPALPAPVTSPANPAPVIAKPVLQPNVPVLVVQPPKGVIATPGVEFPGRPVGGPTVSTPATTQPPAVVIVKSPSDATLARPGASVVLAPDRTLPVQIPGGKPEGVKIALPPAPVAVNPVPAAAVVQSPIVMPNATAGIGGLPAGAAVIPANVAHPQPVAPAFANPSATVIQAGQPGQSSVIDAITRPVTSIPDPRPGKRTRIVPPAGEMRARGNAAAQSLDVAKDSSHLYYAQGQATLRSNADAVKQSEFDRLIALRNQQKQAAPQQAPNFGMNCDVQASPGNGPIQQQANPSQPPAANAPADTELAREVERLKYAARETRRQTCGNFQMPTEQEFFYIAQRNLAQLKAAQNAPGQQGGNGQNQAPRVAQDASGPGSDATQPQYRVVQHPDGSKEFVWRDGTSVREYPDGSSTIRSKDGMYQKSKDGNSVYMSNDGRIIVTNTDGGRTTLYPDGSRLVTTPDGKSTLIEPNGSATTVSDNTQNSTPRSVGNVTKAAGASTVQVSPDGKTRTVTSPSGDRQTTYPDGHEARFNKANGAIEIRYPDGENGFIEAPDGTRTPLPPGSFPTGVSPPVKTLSDYIPNPLDYLPNPLNYVPNPTQALKAAGGVIVGAGEALCGVGKVAGSVVVGGTASLCGADPKGYFGDAIKGLDELADGLVAIGGKPSLIVTAPLDQADRAIANGDAFGAGRVVGEQVTNVVLVVDSAVSLGRAAAGTIATRGVAAAAEGGAAATTDAAGVAGRAAAATQAVEGGTAGARAAGATAKALPKPATPPANGVVALDANALIRGLENGELAAVDAAIAGRTPTISITAAKEFLKKGDVNVLRQFLLQRGGRVGTAATAQQIADLQAQATVLGRVLRPKDAAVTGSAINEGATIITRDVKLLRFLRAAGVAVQEF